MSNDEFKSWVRGYLALTDENYLDARQVTIIKNHAALVKATLGNVDQEIDKFIMLIQQELEENKKICISMIKQFF